MPYGKSLKYDGKSQSFIRSVVPSSTGDIGLGDYLGDIVSDTLSSIADDLLSSPVINNQNIGNTLYGTPSMASLGATTASNTPMVYGGASLNIPGDSYNYIGTHWSQGDPTLTMSQEELNVMDSVVIGEQSGSLLGDYGGLDPSNIATSVDSDLNAMLSFVPEYDTGEWGDPSLYIQQFFNPLYTMENDMDNDTFIDVIGDRGTRMGALISELNELAIDFLGGII